MNEKLNTFIETSFLSDLLKNPQITDISYNGLAIFYMDNDYGRCMSDIKIDSGKVLDFLRQIANLAERQFSYSIPMLDISFDKYRLNAVHPSVARKLSDKVVTFSLRIASKEIRIKNNGLFLPPRMNDKIFQMIRNKKSIVIAGPTGSGKTEFQKYLISNFDDYTRVVTIDSVLELNYVDYKETLDVTSWQVSPNNPNASMNELIKNALRSNPDWLIIAESRGEEMNEVLTSAMTGHPIITTLHAKSLNYIPERIACMIEAANKAEKHDEILRNVFEHFDTYILLGRSVDKTGKVIRYVDEIGISDVNKVKCIYKRSEHESS